MINKMKDYFVYILAIIALVAASFIAVQAQQSQPVNIENCNDCFGQSGFEQTDETLGARTGSGSRFTDLISTNSLEFQDLIMGSRYSTALTFTAAATTTPGGLFTLQNTGDDKLCTTVMVDVTTGSITGGRTGAGHPLQFSVSTSTDDTTWSASTVGVLASTTLATTTTATLDTVVSPGSYVGTDQDIGGAPWEWDADVYLLGTFDGLTTDAATSSAVYTDMAGKMYVSCIDK